MSGLKFSIVIAYDRHPENIRLAFAGLADQTLDRSQFEVVVGVLEYSPELSEVCEGFADRLDIVTVMSDAQWNAGHARNIAMRNVSGQVLLAMDADMIVPTRFLENLYERYFQHGQNICVVGRTLDYEEVADIGAEAVDVRDFAHYRRLLADVEQRREVHDDRWVSAARAAAFARLPWVRAVGAPVALPVATVRQHTLHYDEGFLGQGPQGQEWARRICLTGTPLVLGEQVYSLRLPSPRRLVEQNPCAAVDWRNYLRRHQELDAELSIAYGQSEMERIYPEVQRQVTDAAGVGRRLGVVSGTADGRSIIAVGALLRDGRVEHDVSAVFDARSPVEVHTLAGFALPYDDHSVDEIRILPPIARLDERYRRGVVREAERVAVESVARLSQHQRQPVS